MQYRTKIIALFTSVCLLVGMMVVPSAAADDTQMYFYNGVELPALSMFETYSYVFIEDEGDGKYTAHCSASPLYLKLDSSGDEYVLFKEIPCAYYYYDVSISPVWREGIVNDTWGGIYIKYIVPLWSNHDIVNSVDGTVYIKGTRAIPVDSVSDIPGDDSSILDVLLSLYDLNDTILYTLGQQLLRLRYIEESIAALAPSEQETALKEATSDVTSAYTEKFWGADSDSVLGSASITESADILSGTKSLFSTGVSTSDLFGLFGRESWGRWFSEETRADLHTVPDVAVIGLDEDDAKSEYEKNLDSIRDFLGR